MDGTMIEAVSVGPNGRYFVDQNGDPFFWLGDTQWELFRLFTLDEARAILENRRSKGFSVIQVMLTGVGDGTKPNLAGQTPWVNNDPSNPNERYFENVDSIIRIGQEKELIFALGIFHQLQTSLITMDNARKYSEWVASRYRNEPNIIWTMYPQAKQEFVPILRELAAGLREGDKGKHMITVHPDPAPASSSFIHDESWLAFNMIQTCIAYDLIYKMVSEDYARKPVKPVVMAEGGYEGVEFGKLQTPLEIRKQAYWSHLAGGHHSYGHNDNWSSPSSWRSWIDSPGSFHMLAYRKIITSCREWWNLVPDQSVFFSGEGSGFTLNVAACSAAGDWVLAYLSSNTSVSIRLDKVTAGSVVEASLIDPTTGIRRKIGRFASEGVQRFTTPGDWEDAVLLLETR
ncbi:MAG: DUF4038 domain-containing protein [Thermoproteota archaeon]